MKARFKGVGTVLAVDDEGRAGLDCEAEGVGAVAFGDGQRVAFVRFAAPVDGHRAGNNGGVDRGQVSVSSASARRRVARSRSRHEQLSLPRCRRS